jgi:hypothetical protein
MPADDAQQPSTLPDWPPPPHDPRERVAVATIDGWEVRVFPPDDRKFSYFVTRGFLHVQLWHPQARVSVLTPSRLTGGQYEAFPCGGWKAPVDEPAPLRDLIGRTHGIAMPSLPRLAAIIAWYVHAEERRAARRPQSARPLAPAAAAIATPARMQRDAHRP